MAHGQLITSNHLFSLARDWRLGEGMHTEGAEITRKFWQTVEGLKTQHNKTKTQIWKNFPILPQLYFSFVFHHYHEPVPVGWLWWIDIVSWIYFVVVFLLRPFPSKMNVSGADAIWLLSTEGLQSSYQQIIFKILFLIITGTCINITTGSVGEYVGKDETKMARRCDPIAGRADAFLTCVWVSERHNA